MPKLKRSITVSYLDELFKLHANYSIRKLISMLAALLKKGACTGRLDGRILRIAFVVVGTTVQLTKKLFIARSLIFYASHMCATTQMRTANSEQMTHNKMNLM